MRRRTLGAAVFGSFLLAGASHIGQARASGALVASGSATPVEQRVAVAGGPDRTTLWTSLHLEADAGPIALVIPVPPGASLDISSDAWFEALEVATAPRVLPPNGVSSTCPNSTEPGELFHVAGRVDHTSSLLPEEVQVLADGGAVSVWASSNGMWLSDPAKAALSTMAGMRFLAARFEASGQSATTRTIRVVMPGAEATLPLSLTRAGDDKDLLVTTWLIGPGAGGLVGATAVEVPEAKIAWDAKTSESSYAAARASALLAAGPVGAALECAGHDPLSHNLPVADGKASITGVITTLFERAGAYGDGAFETDACIAQAAAALASATPVAASCPRADLGVVDGADTCSEMPGGYTDPAALRCGDGADDVAVALSGLVPAETWLTRQSMLIERGTGGLTWALKFAPGAALSPVVTATSVDLGACFEEPDAGSTTWSSGSGFDPSSSSGGMTSGGSNNPSGGSPTGGPPNVYVSPDVGCDCSGTADTVDYWEETAPSDDGDTYESSSGDDCSSDTTSSSGDDCGGDTSESYGSSGDSCDSGEDPGGSDNCTGDTSSSEDCSGDTGSSGESCDSGSGSADSCDSGGSSGSDCSVASGRRDGAKRRAPKLSAMTLGLLALIAPLRRAGTRKRQRGPKAAKK